MATAGPKGTALVEEDGAWSAQFDHGGKRWRATGESAPDLLRRLDNLIREARKRIVPVKG